MALTFNYYEQNYLQVTVRRWYDYKGTGVGGSNFSAEEHAMLVSMLAKVQVAPGTPISFTAAEADMLRTLLYIGKQDYGRGSGGSVFETGVRQQVQQRTVEINGSILAKLNNEPIPIVNVPEQSDPGAIS